MSTHVVIQSRSSSNRLPFKSLFKIDKYFAIELLYKRVYSKKYKTTVLTSHDNSDDYLCYLLNKKKIKFFRGNLHNVKKRFLSFSKKFKNDDIIVRLTGDNLLVDRNLVKYGLKNFISAKKNYLFIGNKFSNLPYGISVEIFRYSYLKKCKNFSKLDKEHVTYSFDKSKKNNIKIKDEKKEWKKINTTMDYLEDYQIVKKIFEKVNNPASISWKKIIDVFFKVFEKKIYNKNKFTLISNRSKNLTKKNVIDICSLKMQEWKYPLKEQLKYFKNNFKKNEINNMIYLNNHLVGYTLLKKKKFDIKKSYILIDTVIIDKDYRKKNLSNILMSFNNSEIIKSKLPSYLRCKDQHVEFYKKFYWKKVINAKYSNIKTLKNLNLMSFNLSN